MLAGLENGLLERREDFGYVAVEVAYLARYAPDGFGLVGGEVREGLGALCVLDLVGCVRWGRGQGW